MVTKQFISASSKDVHCLGDTRPKIAVSAGIQVDSSPSTLPLDCEQIGIHRLRRFRRCRTFEDMSPWVQAAEQVAISIQLDSENEIQKRQNTFVFCNAQKEGMR